MATGAGRPRRPVDSTVQLLYSEERRVGAIWRRKSGFKQTITSKAKNSNKAGAY